MPSAVAALFFVEGTFAFAVTAAMAAAVDSDPDLVALSRASIEVAGELEVVADMLAAGEVRVEYYADIDEGARLVGPLVCVGHCMEAMGFDAGTVVFADPRLEVRSGDTVVVTNYVRGTGPMGALRAASVKILERLGDQWWLRDTTGAGLPLHPSISIVGRVAVSIHLPEESQTVRFARAETDRIYANLPPDRPLPEEVAREVGKDRSVYPSRPIIGPLFWRTLGLPSVIVGQANR